MRKPATKAEKARLARVKQLPCIACLKLGMLIQCGPTEAHHLLSGGRRRGHAFTVSLGVYHHRGLPDRGHSITEMEKWYGPSLANGSKPFHEAFGSDEALLAETNKLLDEQSVEAA